MNDLYKNVKKPEVPFHTVVIDCDIVCHRTAAACEVTSIVATHEDKECQGTFKNRTEYKAHLETLGKLDQYSLATIEERQKLKHNAPRFSKNSLTSLHKAAEDSIDATISSIKERLGVENVVCLIDGGGNFRKELPLPKPYKWNRVGKSKPLLFQHLKDHLLKTYTCLSVAGVESDDVGTTHQYRGWKEKGGWVHCSNDKDRMATCGWTYDHVKDELFYVPNSLGELRRERSEVKGYGRIWLAFQVLYGDDSDGYSPSDYHQEELGKVGAYNLLKDCKTDKEVWQVIIDKFKGWFNGSEYTPTWQDILQIYIDVAHMQRWDGDRMLLSNIIDKLELEI